MLTYTDLKEEAETLFPELVAWRRDFHAHPELGLQEVRTAGVVASYLQELGLEATTGIGVTGVVAMVEPDDFDPDAPVVMLRFDMDALPIQEVRDVPYKSTVPNVMHACGHDGHTAIGMGVATLLNRHRNELPGRVKLVFQPGEEGLGGARKMIADGVLENPAPQASFGMHLWSRLPLNQVVVQPGPLWAGGDFIRIRVYGKGGHGAIPEETVDATLVASQIVVGLQTIVARNVSPADQAVVSIGILKSGTAGNVISGYAELTGGMRTLTPETRALLIARVTTLAEGIAASMGARAEVEIPFGIGPVVNSEEGARVMQRVAKEVVDPRNVVQIKPMMVSEDMTEFLNRVPGCYIMVGASDPAQPMHAAHHNPEFDFDERVLPTGVAMLAGAAVEWLREHDKMR